jgi:hypothetical protein
MKNKLVAMTSTSFVQESLLDNFFPDEETPDIRTLSDLRDYLLSNLGPLSRDALKVVLLALNDYTAEHDDPDDPLIVLRDIVVVSKDDHLPMSVIHDMAIQHRDRSDDIVIKEVPVENSDQTLLIGSISDRAYVTVIITSKALSDDDRASLENELYAFSWFIEDAYEVLQPFRVGELQDQIRTTSP